MRINIDLLPNKRKKAIRKQKKIKMVIKQEVGLFVPLILFICMLFAINFILKIQKDSLESIEKTGQEEGQLKDLKDFEDKFSNTNSKVLMINRISDNHLKWTDIFREFGEYVPENVYIKEISTKDYKIFLMGKAKDREELISFQSILNESNCFNNVNIPLSNLVNKSDLDFQMDININKECLLDKNKK